MRTLATAAIGCNDDRKMYLHVQVRTDKLRQRVTYKLATLVHKCVNGRAPECLSEFCHPSIDRRPGMRSAASGKVHVPRTQTSFGDSWFAVAGPSSWNNLPDAIRDSSLTFSTFTKLLKSYLFVCLPRRL